MTYDLPVAYSFPVTTEVTAPCLTEQGRALPRFGGRILTARDGTVAVGKDNRQPAALAQPPLPAWVSVAPEPTWFERLMPGPKDDIAPHLQGDLDLGYRLQDPVLSRAFYDEQVALRQEKKQTGEEYTFAPFLVTLENMRRLTAHILDDGHFDEPLEPDERVAFLALQGYIRQMMDLQAPYKRTIKLALLMTTMLEIVTARHVIDGPHSRVPGSLREDGRLSTFSFHGTPDDAAPPKGTKAGQMLLGAVLSCRWGGLNPEGVHDENRLLFGSGLYALGTDLTGWLDDDRMFLYPSFAPLGVRDFACFGHLPIYPLGMITRYALNADGQMMTPLAFMAHDAAHVRSDGSWQQLASGKRLDGIDSRLLFRQLALDSLSGAGQGMERAVELVLFNLFHEKTSHMARWTLEFASFLPLFNSISRVRRRRSLDYPEPYRKISDFEALWACCQVHWLYHQLEGLPALEPEEIGPWSQQLLARFEREKVPALRAHWSFFETRRAALSAWFLANARDGDLITSDNKGHLHYGYASCHAHAEAIFHKGGILMFNEEYDSACRGPVDYLDVAYFEVVEHPDEYRRLAQDLGEELPPWPRDA